MEAGLDTVAGFWANRPALPGVPLPAPADPPLLLVLATLLTVLAVLRIMSGWIDSRSSPIALLALFFGLGLFYWVWSSDREGFDWLTVPEAFVELAARLSR